jgi:phenylacetate-CoA ligase
LNIFEITLQLNGYPIAKAKRKLLEIQAVSEVDYKEYVLNKRREIVEFHLKNNPFYSRFVGSESFSDWNLIPVMEKSDLQTPLARRLSRGFTKKNAYVNKTSGSSGHPFIFAKDKYAHALSWAEFIDRYNWFNLNFKNSLQARFYGIPLNTVGYQKERLKDRLSARYRFPIFDLSEEKMEHFLTVFRRKKFEYINGYTSSIVLFAKFLQRKNIILKNVCPSLRLCIVTSEMLFEDDKSLLKSTFGVSVVNEYGASELGLIGFTNEADDFIANSECLFIEILDQNNNPVPNGIPGRIVITSFYNKAHPIIRYDIGDTGILSATSTLKRPIIEKLIGRTNDVAKLPSGKTVPGLTFYYVTKSIIEDDGNVKEFIIIQLELDVFKILYTSYKPLTTAEKGKIQKALFTYIENKLNLEFERVGVLERSNSGKLKQFISKL